jgi:O-antigen ligase
MTESIRPSGIPPNSWEDMDGITLVFSIAAAALGALALWIPSGYSIAATFLLLSSLWVLLKRGMPTLGGLEWALIATMLAYSVIWMADAVLRGQGVSGMDQASRFIFAVPVLLCAAHIALRWDWIWLGTGAGGYGALAIATAQVYQQGMSRASGFIGPEPFGNISALLAGLALLGALWLRSENRHPVLYLFTAIGGVAALGAVALSGTRASWVALLPVFLIVLILAWLQVRGRQRLGVGAFVFIVLLSVGGLLAEPISKRFAATHSDLTNYFAGVGEPQSVGTRFELWKGSLHLFAQKPLVGWGSNAYKVEMGNLGDAGYIEGGSPGPNHAHNELIDALAKKGLIGAIVILAIYVVPGVLFLRRLTQAPGMSDRILSSAGLAVIITSGLYGMAHTSLENNASVMNYAFWLALFVGSVSAASAKHHISSRALQAA